MISVLLAGALVAATPTPEPPLPAPCEYVCKALAAPGSMYGEAWQETGVIVLGNHTTPFVGARLQGVAQIAPRVDLIARIDASRLGDGNPVNIADPKTYSTIEGEAGAAWRVWPFLGVAGFVGRRGPLGSASVSQRYSNVDGGGILVGAHRGGVWAILGAGQDNAAGPGAKLLWVGQARVSPLLSLGSDGAAGGGKGSFGRVYSLIGWGK